MAGQTRHHAHRRYERAAGSSPARGLIYFSNGIAHVRMPVLLFIKFINRLFMKKINCSFVLLIISICSLAQPAAPAPEILYGAIHEKDLRAAPYNSWFVTNYSSYEPNAAVMKDLQKINTKGIQVEVFLGTWCGDSKREVPRFLRMLHDLSFDEKNVKVIGLGGSDSLYKRSPQQEEAGKGIFRVPVFIVYKNGIEVNRINEFPVHSLEKDFYSILSNQPYEPNYRSFATIRNWLHDGTLLDKNNSTRGLAGQLKPLVSAEYELNSLGYLLLGQGKTAEALKVFQINASLYPESANIISSLGEGYLKTGDTKNAIVSLERALEVNKDPQLVKGILKILYEAKSK
jgi:tetratricopeptide (TPR) repeat protein